MTSLQRSLNNLNLKQVKNSKKVIKIKGKKLVNQRSYLQRAQQRA